MTQVGGWVPLGGDVTGGVFLVGDHHVDLRLFRKENGGVRRTSDGPPLLTPHAALHLAALLRDAAQQVLHPETVLDSQKPTVQLEGTP